MKQYIKCDSESLEYIRELIIDIGDVSNDGYKLAKRLNLNSETNFQADLSGQLMRLFEQAQDLVDKLSQEL